MRLRRVSWSSEDEQENLQIYGVNFKEAKEVVLNPSSLSISNIDGDYLFLGPTDKLDKILAVYCVTEDEFRRIAWAKRATNREVDAYFDHLAQGDFL